jgi:hypothetical protein
VVNLLFLALVPALVVGLAAFLGGWLMKPHPLKGKTLLVGLRATTQTSGIRAVNTTRGVYEWVEKGAGDFKADVHLDNAFIFNGRVRTDHKADPKGELRHVDLGMAQTWDDRGLGMKVVVVDLDTQQPIRWEGVAKNDDEVVKVNWFGVPKELKYLWSRLTGVRLYQIRKDTRLKQLAAVATSMWEFLTKALPAMVIAILVILLVIIILLFTVV